MQPFSGNQRPDLLTSLMNLSLVPHLPAKCIFDHLCRSFSNVPLLPSFLQLPQNPRVDALLTTCRIHCACHAELHPNLKKLLWDRQYLKCFARRRRAFFSTSQLPKVVRSWCALYILTSKCGWRHNTARTSSTSQLRKVLQT